MSRLIDADELERRIREAEKIFYDIEDVGIAIDCIDATKTISEWHYPSKGELPLQELDGTTYCPAVLIVDKGKLYSGAYCENLLSSTEGECSCKISPRFVEYRTKPIDVIKCENYTPKTEPKASEICINCEYYSTGYCNKHDKPTRYDNICSDFLLYKPKTEQKAEPNCENCIHLCKSVNPCLRYEPKTNYRPFKDTDELIKTWIAKRMITYPDLCLPHIWVRRKEVNSKGQLITEFGDEQHVSMGNEGYNMTDLFVHFTFLDGSVCGVEE